MVRGVACLERGRPGISRSEDSEITFSTGDSSVVAVGTESSRGISSPIPVDWTCLSALSSRLSDPSGRVALGSVEGWDSGSLAGLGTGAVLSAGASGASGESSGSTESIWEGRK